MPHTPIVGDLAIVMLVAGLVTLLCHWLRQPVVLGYILAGLIVGPYTLPFPLITSPESIQTLAELGVVMLMFGLGLEFSLRRLAQVAPTALIAGTLEILLMIWIGYQLGGLFGWNPTDRLFLGAMLLSSSTVLIAKVLRDLGWMHQRFAQVVFGILILDDIFAVATIALLSGIALSGSSGMQMITTAGRIGLFLTVVLVAGLLLVPRLLRRVVHLANEEVLLITVLALGLGMALVAVKLGFSAALGAFLIGAVIGETPHSARVRQLIEPVRDMFSAVFFVAVGLMLDPRLVAAHWPEVFLVTIALVLGKIVTGACGALVAGHDLRTSLRVGMSLAQIGEFAFIITKLGQDLGLTSDGLFPIGVSVASLSALLSPILIRNSDALATVVERAAPAALRQFAAFYVRWVHELSSRHRHAGPIRSLLRKWTLQMALNLILVTAVFGAAGAVKRWGVAWLARIPELGGLDIGHNTFLLLFALLVSMPMLIATLRKLRAASWLIAEALITPQRTREHTPAVRRLIANTILGGGAVTLALYLLLISSAILPSWPGLILAALIVAGTAFLMWRSFIRVYAKAQIALREVLTQPTLSSIDITRVRPSLLRDSRLESIQLPQNWSLSGRSIADLAIRSSSGACIVAVERGEQIVLNPGGDQVLEAGDRILLLGRTEQIRQTYLLLGLKPSELGHPSPSR